MALSQALIDELKKGNRPVAVFEVALDSGTVYYGTDRPASSTVEIQPILDSVPSLTNKIDPDKGFVVRGDIRIVVTGYANIQSLVSGNYLMSRRVTGKLGTRDMAYSDFSEVYTGKITSWSRSGGKLTITISDDLVDTDIEIPDENEDDTQYIDYTGAGAGKNPIDIMTDILQIQLGISASYIDLTQFQGERDTWYNSWLYSRVITEPKKAMAYLKELQKETDSFIVHDGQKISHKAFQPPVPGTTVEEWTDNFHILSTSLTQDSGYDSGFYNEIVFYYNYDESGSDDIENFENSIIESDLNSQSAAEHDRVSTKIVKSRWIKDLTFGQPVNISSLVLYHAAARNGAGTGTLTFTYDAGGDHTLQWTPPGGSAGSAVTVSETGKYDLYGADEAKYVRVIVTDYAALPGSNKTDSITLTTLNGSNYARGLARRLLNRYRDPASTIKFKVGFNSMASAGEFIKPTDLKDVTTVYALGKGKTTWSRERVMLTGARLDFEKKIVKVTAVEASFSRRPGFIAPAGQPDYPAATAAQREYAYIGDANNKVNGGTEDGYYIV